MECRMDGRVALITGGSRGLGKAMAETFAKAGAEVAIVARRPDVLQEAAGELSKASNSKVVGIAGDVGKLADCQRVFDQAVAEFGRVDVLVNNAGTSIRGPFLEQTEEVWAQDYNLKVMAAIRLCRLAIPGMRDRKWGRIINILSGGAKAPRAEGAPTNVSRATGMALTKVLANEFAPDNVLVNALMTGNIVTDQIARRYARAKPDMSFEQFVAEAGKKIPMRRMGTAQEYANMACFLASDAGSYITGTAINVDGGNCPVV
jgi:NAD(P)-dependent dehydrogenase (short-subunit alcohol dehydrogenase family)